MAQMASVVDLARLEQLHHLVRNCEWAEAVAYSERELSGSERSLPEVRLPYAIALIRGGQEEKGAALIDATLLDLPDARADLRRFVISPLVNADNIEVAARLLDRIVAARPSSIDDRRLRASLKGRLKQWPAAIEDARMVLAERPDDPAAQRPLIQLLLQAGSVEEAGAEAAKLGEDAAADPRLANIALLALARSGRSVEAARLAIEMADAEINDERTAAAIVRTLVETGHGHDAIKLGERLLEEGWEHEVIRSSLAQAYLASLRDDRYERAIEHLREGLGIAPRDIRMNMAMGESLLRTRNYSEALRYLETACELQPKGAQQRALYARALKQVGRYEEAAEQFRALLELQPSSARWARYAAGALSQSGQRREAAKLFEKFVGARRSSLPRNFEKGLDALWERVPSTAVPKPRLDWAWSLRNDRSADRAEWERRAKWGHLADHYMLDWLECRDDRIHDVMLRLADLGEAERVLGGIDRSNGMILASAHIGPMYAGPLALELLGVRSRWLASTPSVARTVYSKSLISTSEQDDMDVGKAFMKSLRQGYSVVIAVDGAINLAAPRILFEGQEMTYSSFAARTAHRMGVPSVFAAPKWEGERIGFVIVKLPDPEEGEDADDFAERWKHSYLAALRDYLGGPPENLRLSGGLWRHIR
jgi:tetratricopeptide (TPR) repeat protein